MRHYHSSRGSHFTKHNTIVINIPDASSENNSRKENKRNSNKKSFLQLSR